MKEYILILSSLYDFSTDLVVQRLEKAGENYIRLNKEQFQNYDIFLDPLDGTLQVKSDFGDDLVNSVKSVWFRQPVFLRNTPGKHININEQLAKSQWNAFLRGLMVFEDAFWMNWPQATYAAESKPYQLMLAKKIGFEVPQTIVSNGLGFTEFEDKDFIIKSIDTVFLREGEYCYFAYTSKVDVEELSREVTKDAPITFQEYIKDKLDLRVTVVKDKVLSVAITDSGKRVSGDWRLLKKDLLRYDNFELPVKIEGLCVKYLEILGLNYGAFDFVKSGDKYFFIEMNPTGEWGWLSTPERQIDEEISQALMAGC